MSSLAWFVTLGMGLGFPLATRWIENSGSLSNLERATFEWLGYAWPFLLLSIYVVRPRSEKLRTLGFVILVVFMAGSFVVKITNSW
jgi:hypothetical protein